METTGVNLAAEIVEDLVGRDTEEDRKLSKSSAKTKSGNEADVVVERMVEPSDVALFGVN